MCASVSATAQTAKIKSSDFEVLTGPAFSGTLTTHNHLLGTTETVNIKLTVRASKEEKNTFTFTYEFPDDATQNEAETMAIVSGGRFLNNQEVAERTQLPNGAVRIITEEAQAEGKRAGFYVNRYLLGKNTFSLRVVEQVRDQESFRPVETYELKR